MSKGQPLQELRVDVLTHKPRQKAPGMEANRQTVATVGRGQEFVYVNPGFVGSTTSVRIQDQPRRPRPRPIEAPQSVVLEQYWACSRWTSGQRFLAIAVAILLGAVIGLAITVVLYNGNADNIVGGGLFSISSAPD